MRKRTRGRGTSPMAISSFAACRRNRYGPATGHVAEFEAFQQVVYPPVQFAAAAIVDPALQRKVLAAVSSRSTPDRCARQ